MMKFVKLLQKYDAQVVIMHMQNDPTSMQNEPFMKM